MSSFSKKLKKWFKQVNIQPITHGLEIAKATARTIKTGDYHHITDTTREHLRSDFLGLRLREAGAIAGVAFGGYAAYGAVAAKSGAAAAAGSGAVSGGGAAAAGGTSAVASGSWLTTIGKTLSTAALVQKVLNPRMGPATIPQENDLPFGLPGAIYPDLGGAGEFGSGGGIWPGVFPGGGVGEDIATGAPSGAGFSPLLIGAIALLAFGVLVFFIRR